MKLILTSSHHQNFPHDLIYLIIVPRNKWVNDDWPLTVHQGSCVPDSRRSLLWHTLILHQIHSLAGRHTETDLSLKIIKKKSVVIHIMLCVSQVIPADFATLTVAQVPLSMGTSGRSGVGCHTSSRRLTQDQTQFPHCRFYNKVNMSWVKNGA